MDLLTVPLVILAVLTLIDAVALELSIDVEDKQLADRIYVVSRIATVAIVTTVTFTAVSVYTVSSDMLAAVVSWFVLAASAFLMHRVYVFIGRFLGFFGGGLWEW